MSQDGRADGDEDRRHQPVARAADQGRVTRGCPPSRARGRAPHAPPAPRTPAARPAPVGRAERPEHRHVDGDVVGAVRHRSPRPRRAGEPTTAGGVVGVVHGTAARGRRARPAAGRAARSTGSGTTSSPAATTAAGQRRARRCPAYCPATICQVPGPAGGAGAATNEQRQDDDVVDVGGGEHHGGAGRGAQQVDHASRVRRGHPSRLAPRGGRAPGGVGSITVSGRRQCSACRLAPRRYLAHDRSRRSNRWDRTEPHSLGREGSTWQPPAQPPAPRRVAGSSAAERQPSEGSGEAVHLWREYSCACGFDWPFLRIRAPGADRVRRAASSAGRCSSAQEGVTSLHPATARCAVVR